MYMLTIADKMGIILMLVVLGSTVAVAYVGMKIFKAMAWLVYWATSRIVVQVKEQ